MQEITFPLDSQAFPDSSVARTWVSEIFSCLSDSQILFLRAKSIFKKFCVHSFVDFFFYKICSVSQSLYKALLLVYLGFMNICIQCSNYRVGSSCSVVNPVALRMVKSLWSFDRSECNRVNT